MLMRLFPFQTILVALVTLGLLTGCGQSDSDTTAVGDQASENEPTEEAHDPHDVPLSEAEITKLKEETANYDDAVARIKEFQGTIQKETTGGEPAKAHRALDNLDVVLERLPEAAQESGVPKEKWQEVNETAQKLRDLFNQVHANIDAGKAPDYAAVADEIDQGISSLASIQPEETK